MSDDSARLQTFFVSFVIGVLLPAALPSNALVVTPALMVTIIAMLLWFAKVWGNREGEPLLPIGGLVFGLLAVLVLMVGALLPMPYAALAIAFAVLHA